MLIFCIFIICCMHVAFIITQINLLSFGIGIPRIPSTVICVACDYTCKLCMIRKVKSQHKVSYI